VSEQIKPRPGQHEGESAAEYMSRVVSNLGHEVCALYDELPCVEAVLQFFELWHTYDTDLWSGVLEAISDGESSEPARRWARRWKQSERLADIRWAVKQRTGAPDAD
jgi:hypothetical protein